MTESETAIGCSVECEQGYRVTNVVNDDGVTYTTCTPEDEVDFECPGAIEFGCPVADPDVFDVACNCEGEMWIDSTCTKAFLCSGPQLESGENPGIPLPNTCLRFLFFSKKIPNRAKQLSSRQFCKPFKLVFLLISVSRKREII